MTVKPLFSIITPTFNQGRYVEHTIKSLLAQTFDDFEHIVVDGGSTDETLDILRRYEGEYRMSWTTGTDDGMYDAINKGLAWATGHIHAYLNSDDLYFPWTLRVVAEVMQANRAIGVVYGDSVNVDEVTGAEHLRLNPPFDEGRLRYVWSLVQPAAFWRSEVSDSTGGFDPEYKYVGDWDFFIRASEHFRFAKHDEFLAIERRHQASKTIGEEDPMARESSRMLLRHIRPDTTPTQRRLLRIRAVLARRRTWLRFLSQARRDEHDETRPWGRFLAAADIHVDVPRLAGGFIPGMPYRVKAGAVRSNRDWLRPV